MLTNAGRCEPWPGLRELDRAAFGENLGALIDVYKAAMGVSAVHLPGRRSIMEGHSANPAFRAIAVTAPPGASAGGPESGTAAAGPEPGTAAAGPEPGTAAAGPESGTAAAGPIIAFAYGFHGDHGQWWHDLVRAAVTVASGQAAAARWLDDSFEIAEVHVRPEHQRRGIGRCMLLEITGGRAERTAVLSTMDANTPARRLYRSLGFTDLVTSYRFAGAPIPYAVMGAALPLPSAPS
jgi:GNAT superfamily N-acetyltransferase